SAAGRPDRPAAWVTKRLRADHDSNWRESYIASRGVMMTTAVSSVGFEAFSGHPGFVLSQVRHKPDRQLPAGVSAAKGPAAATINPRLHPPPPPILPRTPSPPFLLTPPH